MAPKKKTWYTRLNPDPNPPAIFDNPNLIPKSLRKPEKIKRVLLIQILKHPNRSLFTFVVSSPSSPLSLQNLFSTPPSTPLITVAIPVLPVVPLFPANMENRYAPLKLPTNPGAMPHDYQGKITYFDGTGTYTAQQHTKNMTNYFENYEIDDDDVRMKFFVQILSGDVRAWFRSLLQNRIVNLDSLYQNFLNRWEKKKYPLHILT